MPSNEHEPLVALTQMDPGVVVWLLTNLFGVEVPEYHHVRTRYSFHSELLRNAAARGQARAILILLDGRGVAVPDDVHGRILECTDIGQLDVWLQRASIATTVDDVIQE